MLDLSIYAENYKTRRKSRWQGSRQDSSILFFTLASLSGSIHGIAALVAVVAFSIGAVLLAQSLRGDLRCCRVSALLLALAIIAVVSQEALLVSLTPALISPRRGQT